MANAVPDPRSKEAARYVQRLRFSVGLLQRNYEELDLAVRYLTSPRIYHAMSGLDDRWHVQEAMEEVLFLLHNYVASAKSLVDHTRRTYQKFYRPTGLIPDYQQQKSDRFADDPLTNFVHDLRNMAQHYRLPSIGISVRLVNRSPGATMQVNLELHKSDLLEFGGWTPPAARFLATLDEDIGLMSVVSRYHAHVTAFHGWFREQQVALHGTVLAIHDHLTVRGIHFSESAIFEAVRTALSALSKKDRSQISYSELHGALLPALSAWDSRRLSLCEYDARTWIEYALTVLSRRFMLPIDVREVLLGFVPLGA